MNELKGNIWDIAKLNDNICITTNGTIKKNGEAVMGRGIALQAKQKYPILPSKLGKLLMNFGNQVYYLYNIETNGTLFKNLFSFPVKHNWWEKADIELIKHSLKEIIVIFNRGMSNKDERFLIPRPGCGNGGLNWKDVKPELQKVLDEYSDYNINNIYFVSY